MSLFTLLEAAEYVESKKMGKELGARATSPVNGRTRANSCTSDSDSDKAKRRPGGAGTREIHNQLEKNRRAQLKICFETLKGEIPTLEDRKTSNLNILKSALRYIQNLEKKKHQYIKEREDLQKHNLSLREKLKVLRTDIKNLIELKGKNGLKPEEPTLALESPPPSTESGISVVSGQSPTASDPSPVSVATQTMPLLGKVVQKKPAEEGNESEEEINVDDES